MLAAVIHLDGWRGHVGLVDIGCNKHYRVLYTKNEYACSENHINAVRVFEVILNAGLPSSTVFRTRLIIYT